MHASPFGRGEKISQQRGDCRWEPRWSINTPIVQEKHFLIPGSLEGGRREWREGKKETVAMPWGWASLPLWCHLTAATYCGDSHTHAHTHWHNADMFTCDPFYSWAFTEGHQVKCSPLHTTVRPDSLHKTHSQASVIGRARPPWKNTHSAMVGHVVLRGSYLCHISSVSGVNDPE